MVINTMVNACRMSVFEYLQMNVCIGVRFFMNARR